MAYGYLVECVTNTSDLAKQAWAFNVNCMSVMKVNELFYLLISFSGFCHCSTLRDEKKKNKILRRNLHHLDVQISEFVH